MDKSMSDSQTKFDEVSNKLSKFRYTGGFLSDLAGNQPLAFPNTLWFGILDLAQNLIQKSAHPVIYNLCYYLTIESLSKAPSSFIQYKAIEILLHKMINNTSERFQTLIKLVQEKCHEDFNIQNDAMEKGKGKGSDENDDFKNEQTISSFNILDVIADEMICPITHQQIIKELEDKNYEKAIVSCQENLKRFPKSYTMRCILAYTYKCFKDYKNAVFYLQEAIGLNGINPIAYNILEKFCLDKDTKQ
ncbi:9459_t:CDS:2, partial [Funneliformis geosporum]